MTPLLETRGLARHFAQAGFPGGRLPAVGGVDLALAPGAALGVIGESGSGKTTLARLIARLIDPDGGEILLSGIPIGATPARRFARHPARREIQMVFQDPAGSFNPRLTARDIIVEPLRGLMRLRGAALGSAVETAAAAVGLGAELLPRYPSQLSGGQQARVGLARAIAPSPRLLVLDEPTAALDVSVQGLVLRLLDGLRRTRGVALFCVSHDLAVVRLLTERVAVMYLGQVVEEGPTALLTRTPAHPYAQALVAAQPRLGAGRPRVLIGSAAESAAWPVTGCRFAPRCPLVQPLCRAVAPALRPLGPGHAVRCHLAGEPDGA